MNDSKQDGFPINEENLRRSADTVAAAGPFMERRAAEFGRALGREFAKMHAAARGVEWTAR